MELSRETYLTSTAVTKTDDGNYDFHIAAMLMPHETIRREFLRLELAIQHLNDVTKHPWKAINLYTWLSKYFLLAIHSHHDNEENIFGLHYKSLGEDVEFGHTISHKDILKLINLFEKSVLDLYNEILKFTDDFSLLANGENQIVVENLIKEIQKSFATLNESMLIHLAEEEVFWPPIILRHGKEEDKKVVNKVLSEEMKKKGEEVEAFKVFAGSSFDAMGYGSEKMIYKIANMKQISPWCSEQFLQQVVADAPVIARLFIFSSWHKNYVRKWKLMIDSITGEEDFLKLKTDTNNNCLCTVT